MNHHFLLSIVSTIFLLTSNGYTKEYSKEDLKALIKSEQFIEAFDHLKDIPPTERNTEWETIASSAVVGTTKQFKNSDQTCQRAWNFVSEVSNEMPALKENKSIRQTLVETGVCYMKNGRFWEPSDKRKIGEAVLLISPEAIYQLALDAKWDPNFQFIRYLNQHPEKYMKDARVHEYVLYVSNSEYWDEAKDMDQIKFSLLKKFNLYQKFVQDHQKNVSEVSRQLIQGDRSKESDGENSMRALERAKADADDIRARFFVPLIMCKGQSDIDEILPKLQKTSIANIQKVEKDMISSNPKDAFWFCGSWNEEQLQKMKKLTPNLIKTAKKECEAFTTSGKKTKPIHVNTYKCNELMK